MVAGQLAQYSGIMSHTVHTALGLSAAARVVARLMTIAAGQVMGHLIWLSLPPNPAMIHFQLSVARMVPSSRLAVLILHRYLVHSVSSDTTALDKLAHP